MELTAVALIIAILAGATALGMLFYYTWKRREEGAYTESLSELVREGLVGQPPVHVIPELTKQLFASFSLEESWYLECSGGELKRVMVYPKAKPEAFTIACSNKLKEMLSAEYAPFSTEVLAPFISADTGDILKQESIRWCLPVFGGGTVYGIFLFSTHAATLPEAGKRTASLIAQLLAQVYQVWHAASGVPAQTEVNKADDKYPALSLSPTMFKLALRRGPESVVPVLIDSLKKELGVDRLSLLFNQESRSGSWYRVGDSGEPVHDAAGNAPLERIFDALQETQAAPLAELSSSDGELASWVNDMRNRGFNWVAPFAISARQRGILIGSGTKSGKSGVEQLTRAAAEASHIVEVAEYSRQLHEMSYTDALTGLANHRYFCRRLDEEISRAHRYARHLALIMFDVDDLKYVNDVHGHLAGDELLRQLAVKARGSMRGIDLLARYGGDEFCIIMPETDGPMSIRFMERLQADIASLRLQLEEIKEPFKASISQGAAIYPEAGADGRTLLHHADTAMIKAKSSGRNSFLLYSES